jgi:hypothetical protein
MHPTTLIGDLPVPGFSGVGRPNGSYQMPVDKCFGTGSKSSDALLRIYAVQVNWAAKSVSVTNFHTACLRGFGDRFLELSSDD